jgi:hypothetical protein
MSESNQENNNELSSLLKSKPWIFGILMALGLAIALTVALENLPVGLAVGIGAGLLFTLIRNKNI